MDKLIKQVDVIALADELAFKSMFRDLIDAGDYGSSDDLYEDEHNLRDYPKAIYEGYYEHYMDIIYNHVK
jgi:hypothetical protein